MPNFNKKWWYQVKKNDNKKHELWAAFVLIYNNFIIFILSENIYITIDNVRVSGRHCKHVRSCKKKIFGPELSQLYRFMEKRVWVRKKKEILKFYFDNLYIFIVKLKKIRFLRF